MENNYTSRGYKSSMFACLLFFLLSTSYNYGADWYVNDNNTTGDIYTSAPGNITGTGTSTNPFIDLATALTVAISGDNIYVDTGTYNDIFLTLTSGNISIIGAGSSSTIFDNAFASADTNWFLNIAATATGTSLTGIRISGYNVLSTGTGKAITVSGATGVIFTDVNTSNNGAGSGDAALRIEANSEVTINNSSSACNASGGLFGGGIDIDGANITVNINDSSVSSNFKTTKGSGIYINGVDGSTNVTLNNCIVTINDSSGATGEGSGIYVQDATLNANNCEFSNNSSNIASANEYGGGILVGRGAIVNIDSCLFAGNTADRGSGLAANTASANGNGLNSIVTIINSTFDNNELAGRESSGRLVTINVNQTDFINGANIANYNSANITLTDSGNPSVTGTVNFTNTNNATTAISSPSVPSLSGDNCSILACPDAGTNNTITICDKSTFDQGLGNPLGTVDLFALLGGTPDTGGVWNDDDSSGGLDILTGLLNTWAINNGGVFNYTYTVTSTDPGCPGTSTATITVTLAGYPGTDNPAAVACDTNPSVNMFSFLGFNPSATFGGTWSDDDGTGALSGQFFDATSVATNTPFDFTYTVPAVGICPSTSATVTITVFPSPEAGTPTDLVVCETDDLSIYSNLNLFDQLTGEDAGGSWTDTSAPNTGEIANGLDSFINVDNINTNFGPGTYTFQYTVNPSNPICAPQSSTVTIIIEPIVDINGATLSVVPSPICFADLGTTTITATITEGAIPIPDGIYDITYTTGGAPNIGSETVSVTFTGGVGSWTVNPTFLNGPGTVTVDVTNILDPSTTTNCERVITNLNTTFDIDPTPDPSDTLLTIDDVCIGESAIGTVSDAGGAIELIDDTYTITYTITPDGSSYTATVTTIGGAGTFTIPSGQIPIEGNYTVEITNWESSSGCTAASSIIDTFEVFPLPDAQNIVVNIPDICDGDDLTITITDTSNPLVLVDGTYDIDYDIVGPPDLLGQTEFGLVITGGTGSFTIPAGTLPFGSYSFTITNLVNTVTTCNTTTFSNPATNFIIHEVPNAADVLLAIPDICLNSDGTVTISDANPGTPPDLPDGVYDITYDLSGANVSTGNNTSVTITGTNGTFTIPASLLTNIGNTTVTVTIITNTTTGCDAVGVPIVTNFNIDPIPIIDNATITVTQPICAGGDATVNISGTAVADGDYDLIYDLSGANISIGNTVNTTFTGGATSFTIPAALIPNSGSTTITITNITNTSIITMCANTVSNVSATFIISVNPLIDVTNLEVPEQDICLGEDKDIDVLGTTLADGSYTITYDVSNPASTGNTATMIITSGDGSFTIPAALLTATGNIIITITNITDNATGCSSSINIQTNFNIIPLPDVTGATVDAGGPYCEGDNVQAQILNAIGLADGDYNITYNLSGANTATGLTETVTVTGGTSNLFTIPGLTNTGNTTITITVVSSVATGCLVTGLSISDTFTINPLPTIDSNELSAIDICLNSNGTVTINSLGGLIDGNYLFTYDLSGANTSLGVSIPLTISGGTGSFTIPAASLTNIGVNTVSILAILNTDTGCNNTFTGVSTNFEIFPIPDLVSGNLQIPEEDICSGDDKLVDILGTTITDGDYTITYDISNPASTGNTATVTFTGGDGILTIPNSLLPVSGAVTVTITDIFANTATNCGTSGLSLQTNFNIILIGNPILTIDDICFNDSDAIATITSATGIPDGTYDITYDLSGSNTSTGETATTDFTSGGATFNIPQALLINDGTTTVTITGLTSSNILCGTNNSIAIDSFTLINPSPPTLIDSTLSYCFSDNPTISILESNIDNPLNQLLTWYEDVDGTIPYTDLNTLLDHGQTYYVSFTDNNICESALLAITVDLTDCDGNQLIIPDGFSPNDDGINDTYTIQFIDLLYPNHSIEIYNRYGNIVYKGNINTPDFDGKSNQNSFLSNKELPTGVYFYIIDFNDGDNNPIQGRLYLSR